jgi:6-phosphogluconolactonase (cycloisomerase 2 family)
MKHCLFLAAVVLLSVSPVVAGQFVYVSESGDDSIAIFRQDPQTGELTFLSRQETDGSPGALDVGPRRKFLFAALRSTKTLASFQIDPLTGQLTLLSTTAHEEDPTYVYVDRTGDWLLAASYGAGKVSVHRIRESGRLDPEGLWYTTAEKAHCIRLDRLNWHAFVPHTGPERIYQFNFDRQTGELTPNDQPFVETPAGSGPRHLWFHPKLDVAYVDNEQGSSVTVYDFDFNAGTLRPRDTLSTHPDDFTGNNTNADLEVTPDGRFLYVSNRGHDSIAAFSVSTDDGALAFLGTFPTEQTPRSFNIDPTGRYLYAAGQKSNRLAAYHIRPDGKLLQFAGYETGTSPAWVLVVHTGLPARRR